MKTYCDIYSHGTRTLIQFEADRVRYEVIERMGKVVWSRDIRIRGKHRNHFRRAQAVTEMRRVAADVDHGRGWVAA